MAIPMEVLVCRVGFLYTEASKMLPGPEEIKVSKQGVDSLLLGISVVNCICRSMELLFCKNNCLCSACLMTKVSYTYLSQCLLGFGAGLMALD